MRNGLITNVKYARDLSVALYKHIYKNIKLIVIKKYDVFRKIFTDCTNDHSKSVDSNFNNVERLSSMPVILGKTPKYENAKNENIKDIIYRVEESIISYNEARKATEQNYEDAMYQYKQLSRKNSLIRPLLMHSIKNKKNEIRELHKDDCNRLYETALKLQVKLEEILNSEKLTDVNKIYLAKELQNTAYVVKECSKKISYKKVKFGEIKMDLVSHNKCMQKALIDILNNVKSIVYHNC